MSSIAHGFFNIVTSEMVTDLNNTGKRKRIYTKHKPTTSQDDHIMLTEKRTHTTMRRYSDNDSRCLPSKYTVKKSTLQSPKKTDPSNINDIKLPHNSHDYDPIEQNVTAVPESPAKVFMKFNPS